MTQHESEILPFPNNEKSFSLPDDIIQEVKEGEGTAVRNAAFLNCLHQYKKVNIVSLSKRMLICAFVGKLGSEEESKEEFRMEREPPATHEEGTRLCLAFKVQSAGASWRLSGSFTLKFRVSCSLSDTCACDPLGLNK